MPQPTITRANQAASSEKLVSGGSPFLDGAIFFFCVLFAILLPHSIKGAQHSWQIAFLLWLLKLAVERKRPWNQPLSAPLLAYVTLSGISTILSPDPNLSWDRMKIVCLLLVGIVFAQNLHHLKQVRLLVFLLILSGVAAAAFTAWQYSYGVGVRASYVYWETPLYRAHFTTEDIITHLNHQAIHSPAQLRQIIEQSAPGTLFRIDFLRGYPFHHRETFITRENMLKSGWGTSRLQFTRGHPLKAQGTLGHYVVFAEILMQIGCMTWAMLLCADPRQKLLRVSLAIAFAALTGALFLTETRAALAGLAAGCFAAILILAAKRSRIWATAVLVLLVLTAALWIHHTRGAQWLGANDPGTHFRTMMWQDGLRLIRQHPWFGVGMETIRHHAREWNIRAFTFFHDESHFHSDLVQIAVERGLLTLAAWLWFLIAYVVFLSRLIHKARQRSRFATGVAAGVLASFVAFQTTALVHYDLGIESVAMILFFYFGLAVALDRIVERPDTADVP